MFPTSNFFSVACDSSLTSNRPSSIPFCLPSAKPLAYPSCLPCQEKKKVFLVLIAMKSTFTLSILTFCLHQHFFSLAKNCLLILQLRQSLLSLTEIKKKCEELCMRGIFLHRVSKLSFYGSDTCKIIAKNIICLSH